MPQVSIDTIQKNLAADKRFRERRHDQWTENYLLYRDTVITNRLTQRQSVNVPLMKEVIRTMLARVDDPPDLYFEDLSSDEQKELYMNEYWKHIAERNKLEMLDIIDKKQVMLYGRSFWKLNILDGELRLEILDPQDVLVDRYVNPWDLDSARRIAHIGIFRSLSNLALNPLYDKAAIAELKAFFASPQGQQRSGENAQAIADRNKRMENMGVSDMENPILGETYVELHEIQMKVWDEATKEDVVMVVVVANGGTILMQKPLRDILGINEYTYVTWADDLERTDFWSDGVADIVRVPNQIMNVYFSQLVENGVMRGYGMNFYDSSVKEGWTPAGYAPSPFGFYPLPGKPSEVLHHVEIPELKGHLEEMNIMKAMVQSATASTAIETGEGEKGQRTLGEIELLANRAAKRITAMNKFARQRDVDLGKKVCALVTGNPKLLKPVTLYKKSPTNVYYEATLTPEIDIATPKGYRCRVVQKAQKEADDLRTAQKTKLVAESFPMNAPLQRIAKERMLALLDLPPEQKKEVMDFEAQIPPEAAILATGGAGAPPGPPRTRQTVTDVLTAQPNAA